MKIGWKLAKFHPELGQKFDVFIKKFLDASLLVLAKFHFVLFRLGPKYFGSNQILQLP
jgi:hypothetical protein